jgi:ADP-ribose pyrophosphatase YjhB (NUDIX family)
MDIQLQVGVKVFLKNSENKFLLLQRSAQKYPDVLNRWDLVGGRIIPGTGLLENLQREVLEETRFVLRSKPQLIAAQDILKVPGKHVVRLTYVASMDGVPVLDPGEHISFVWVGFDELHSFEGLDEYVVAVLKGRDSL